MLQKVEKALYVLSFLVTVVFLPPGQTLFGGEEQSYGAVSFADGDYQWLVAKNVNPRPINLEGYLVQRHLTNPLDSDSQLDRGTDSSILPQSLSLLVIRNAVNAVDSKPRTYTDAKRAFDPLPLRILCRREEDQLAGRFLLLSLFALCVGISGSKYLVESAD